MSRKPVIALNTDTFKDSNGIITGVRSPYWMAVAAAGGIPFLLPDMDSATDLRASLAAADGLVLTGGDDLRPERLGESLHPRADPVTRNRDRADFGLIDIILETRMPTLAICLGFQELNIQCGGTIWQDLEDENPMAIPHRGRGKMKFLYHDIEVKAGTHLSRTWRGASKVRVNSAHHQAVRDLGSGLNAVAVSGDGIIEAVEMDAHPGLLGVQWHPERMMDDPTQMSLFSSLVEAASAGIDIAG